MTDRDRLLCAALAAGLAGLALAGCPLPQPLAEVSRVDGGTITPPRVLAESALPPESVVRVRKDCPSAPRFTVQASIVDENVLEPVEARWFLDYTTAPGGYAILRTDAVAAPDPNDPSQTVRALQPLTLPLPAFDPGIPAHVLEVVVSNGFSPPPSDQGVPPNRGTTPGYEAQVFRWVFSYVDAGGACAYP